MRQDAELARGALQVSLDLRLRREARRPVRVGREGERVEVARHVAAAARGVVVPPSPADVGSAFKDDEVGSPGALQLDRRTEAGEPAPDDDGVVLFHVVLLHSRRTDSAAKATAGNLPAV